MIRTIMITVLFLALSSVADCQYPFNYSRSTRTNHGTTYYGNYGQVVGRSFNTPTRTYYSNRNGSMIGNSFTTRSGNTYFNRNYNYNPYSYKNKQ